MKKQIIYLLTIVSFATFYSNVFAQSPDKILKRAVKAIGGEKALRSLRSVESNGMVTRLNDSGSGKFKAITSQPNLYIYMFDLNGFEKAVGFNGKSGWERDSKNGLRTLTGTTSRDFQAYSNYRNNRWFNYKQEKSKLIYSGQANINGKISDVVTLSTAKGVSIKLYFDTVSGLLIREEVPAGDTKQIFDYTDFRSIGGIQEPFTINAVIGDEKYEIKLDSVVHNAQIAKTVFDFPRISNEPLPDIPSLLRELQANEERIDQLLENYTFTQINTKREFDKNGFLSDKESETYQLTFYKGRRIRRLIAKNEKSLSAEDQAKEDKRIEKQIADIEKEIAKKEAKAAKQPENGPPKEDDENRRISIAEVLRASNLINPRRERFRGRDVIVFDFEPNPNFNYKNAKSFLKFFGKTTGVMWIDAEAKQVARLEAVLADNFKVGAGILANLKKGAAFTLENDRINNEIWLPSRAEVNLSVKVLLVKGINVNQITKYSDYQKFNAEVKESKVDEIKKP
jgi:hypothetical protein